MKRPGECIRALQSGVLYSYDPLCGFWEMNLCSLKEQLALILNHWGISPAPIKFISHHLLCPESLTY